MQSVAVAQVHLQYFLSNQITQDNVLLCVFKNITMRPVFIYINVNLKQNKLNKNHWEINMRAFNWNLKKFVSLHMSHSFKRNKQKCYKETKFPWEYKRAMQSSFTDNTILCLCPDGAKWSKNVLSLKKVCHYLKRLLTSME